MTNSEAKPGTVCTDYAGHVMRLARQVPGDASLWECDLWIVDHWSAEAHRVELADLEPTPDALKATA
jgi:hypothetical protein